MNSEDSKLLLKDEVYQLVRCAMEILNGIGHGLHEEIYHSCPFGSIRGWRISLVAAAALAWAPLVTLTGCDRSKGSTSATNSSAPIPNVQIVHLKRGEIV